MSDKFFFKGRQDARQSHIKYGYERNATAKLGSKKYPLTLAVSNAQRKLEIEKTVAEANLFADIEVDESGIENIAELTAMLNKKGTITIQKLPSRNDPCSCGSGKKYKKCCAQ
ncbi:PBPRA1643 family SWIM/SEC-C metal-binding motif protein [Paraglaciecola sp.]|uniref:PBPRA1643 family SWIM/SEC-C metal-binding motif protein n=1 Tax=Paraglaciecola sp. TaxID=1920173 RepID=UPI003EFA2D11